MINDLLIMPELPEVETIKNDLVPVLTRKRIVAWQVVKPRLVRGKRKDFDRYLVGATIKSVNRRAKLLCLELSSGYTLLIHLKMTGQLVWRSKIGKLVVGGHPIAGVAGVPNKHTYITLKISDGAHLYFNDVRQFGYWQLVSTEQLSAHFKNIGVEPLSRLFTVDYLRSQLKRRRRATIKAVVLNQSAIAGIGNIYADESLFIARILPSRRAGDVKLVEIKSLHQAIKNILTKSIRARGTSFNSFVDGLGRTGTYWDKRLVYGRKGEPCPKCGLLIQKTVVAGRGTHFCARCQK